ncbi:MAG: hypothetical protein QGH45_25575 [Myxococcota bacterium]|nr:hypothetical protein [Myxococcota bacterium]
MAGWSLLAVAATVAVTCALHGPLLTQAGDTRALASFHDSHIWTFDHIARLVSGDRPLSTLTDAIGYPETVRAPAIAWVPALLAAPLNPVLGPFGAYNTILLLSPALAVLAMMGLVRSATRAGPALAAAAAVAYALCPYALGCLASGQMAKIQHWMIPLYLWALLIGVRGPRAWLGLPLAAAVTLVAGFTSPSTAVLLPLLALPWAAALVLQAGDRRWPTLGRAAAVLTITALCLLPAQRYYGNLRDGSHPSAFEPRAANWERLPTPAPVAQPEGLFLGRGGLARDDHQTSHVTYLGWPLLLAAMVLAFRRFRGRGLAWIAVGVGVVVAVGPWLVSGDAIVELGPRRIALPAYLLELAGYPMAATGTYYRAVVLASLGLSLALAGGLAGRRRIWAIPLALALATLQVGDALRVTRPLWPRPALAVEGREILEDMRDDPAPGAVLDLPVECGTYEGGVAMLAAVVHGRSTTALPRQSKSYLPRVARLMAILDSALAKGAVDGPSHLAEQGFRYVVWRPWLDDQRVRSRLVEGLGPPDQDGEIVVWMVE